MKSQVVVVSRKWNSPDISVSVNSTEIKVEMSLTAFVESLLEEVGNPALILTKAALATKVTEAAEKVVAEMKDATKHAV